jgi:virulence-associated protein VagC
MCSARISKKGVITEVSIFLIGDSLIISPINKNKKIVPSKIMCLSGLTI